MFFFNLGNIKLIMASSYPILGVDRYGGFISCELASCPRTYSKRCDKNVSTISTTYSSKAPTPILELSHHLQFQTSVCDILRIFSQEAPPGPIFDLAPFSCSAQKFISRQKRKNYVAIFFVFTTEVEKALKKKMALDETN